MKGVNEIWGKFFTTAARLSRPAPVIAQFGKYFKAITTVK